jgi:hypothetical protein
MNARGAAIQGGLAALGLVVAYATWQREPERAPGEVIVIDAGKSDLKKIRFEGGDNKWVELTRRAEGGEEPRVWLKVAADAARKAPERELPGNDGAQRLWDKFTPLHATRALGRLDPVKTKEVGLEKVVKKLLVEAKGATTQLSVGAPPFGGVSDPYVRDEHDQRVYVLGGGILGDLDSAATRLVDRALHGFKVGDFDSVVISAGGKSRTFTMSNAESITQSKLLAKNGKPDDMARNWHDRVWRFFVTDVLGKGENPAAGAPEVSCTVDYMLRGKKRGWLQIGRVSTTAPQQTNQSTSSPPTAPVTEYWGKSEHTASWSKLPSTADEMNKECAKIVGSGE